MLKRILSYIRGIYTMFSLLGKLVMMVLTTFWNILILTGTLVWALAPMLNDVLAWVNSNLTATWEVLTTSGEDMRAAVNAGWPPEVAVGLAHINAYFPLAEALGMVVVLLAVSLVCAIFRIVKSFLPLIAT